MDKPHVAALNRAVEIAGGTQAALAARMREYGLTTASQQLISYWINNEVLLDTEWWPGIEFATGGEVTRKDLRPDIFSREDAA
jgi:DNA-binding transcriptional regulator YdaS (Cro superfamily)